MNQNKILWGAIVFSTFIYALLLYMLSAGWPKPATSFDDALKDTITLALYAAALVDFLIGLMVPRFIKVQRSAWICSLVLFEACAIFGLMAAFLQRDWRLFIAPWVLALIGFVTRFPTAEDRGSASRPSHRAP